MADQTSFFFQLPDNASHKAALLLALPTLHTVDGELFAPPELRAAGRVADHTEVSFHNHELNMKIAGVTFVQDSDEVEWRDAVMPQAAKVVNGDLLPRIVRFCEAGSPVRPGGGARLRFHDAMAIAASYVGKHGYHGWLHLSACHHWQGIQSAKVHIQLEPWVGSGYEIGLQPPRLRVEFVPDQPRQKGSRADIEPILAACQRFGMIEYIPTSNGIHPVKDHWRTNFVDAY